MVEARDLRKLAKAHSDPRREALPCFRLNAAGFPSEGQRTLLITGVPRSGTSFLASVVERLGIPLGRDARDKVSGHGEHVALRDAFGGRRDAEFRAIVAGFDAAHATWAWKLPAMKADLDWVTDRVRNPCFVFTFKEPLSVAMRKVSTGHVDDLEESFRKIFEGYGRLLAFARATPRPVLLVSYDKAMRQLDECIAAVARLGGVSDWDPAEVARGVREDALRY